MVKCAVAGAVGAALAIAMALSIGCGAFIGPAVCGDWRGVLAARTPTTVKSAARHQFYRREGVPVAFRGKTNPLTPSIPLVLAGADDYDLLCAACHGPTGIGNGQPRGRIEPAPADLSGSVSDPSIKDEFLYWTIAEGGAQFETDMPPFKNELSEEQIWRLIAYMRAAFGERTARAGAKQSLALEGRR